MDDVNQYSGLNWLDEIEIMKGIIAKRLMQYGMQVSRNYIQDLIETHATLGLMKCYHRFNPEIGKWKAWAYRAAIIESMDLLSYLRTTNIDIIDPTVLINICDQNIQDTDEFDDVILDTFMDNLDTLTFHAVKLKSQGATINDIAVALNIRDIDVRNMFLKIRRNKNLSP